jgi:hypothetical protein
MDLSHNLPGSVRNSVYAIISTYFLKYLDLISIDLAEYIASLTMQGGKLTEIPETFSLPITQYHNYSDEFQSVWTSGSAFAGSTEGGLYSFLE